MLILVVISIQSTEGVAHILQVVLLMHATESLPLYSELLLGLGGGRVGDRRPGPQLKVEDFPVLGALASKLESRDSQDVHIICHDSNCTCKRCGCPKCSQAQRVSQLQPSFVEAQPAEFTDWDSVCNDAERFYPHEVTLGSNKPVHWICLRCPRGQPHRWTAPPFYCIGL